ncbi:MAG: thioredoxin family protein [Pyrinomonadaceae bacterium]|nr:thioredoxin family protein [Pyrinomonadaceae bacterium]
MSNKRKIEIFSAACPACDEAVQTVSRIVCSSCETDVLDMHQPEVAARAEQLGINRVPAIVVDGKVADCCASGRVNENVLRAAGVGVPQQLGTFKSGTITAKS